MKNLKKAKTTNLSILTADAHCLNRSKSILLLIIFFILHLKSMNFTLLSTGHVFQQLRIRKKFSEYLSESSSSSSSDTLHSGSSSRSTIIASISGTMICSKQFKCYEHCKASKYVTAMKCFVPENVYTHPTEAFCSWHFPIAILPFDIPSLFQFPITLPCFNSGTTQFISCLSQKSKCG